MDKRLAKTLQTACFLALVCCSLPLSAQCNRNILFDKDYFDKDEWKNYIKDVAKDLKEADRVATAKIDPDYTYALEIYQRAHKANPCNAWVNFMIGVCLSETGNFDHALKAEHLERARQLDPNVSTQVDFYLGRAYHLSGRWQEGIDAYKRSIEFAESQEEKRAIRKHIEECRYGFQLQRTPVRVLVKNMGKNINSPENDYGPVITADESELYFTSTRAGSSNDFDADQDGEIESDIYLSKHRGQSWLKSRNIDKPINGVTSESVVGVSPDGTRLIIFQSNRKTGGDLYESVKVGKEWSKPVAFEGQVNTRFNETSASYSYDGKTLYFISDRPGDGSVGGRDIFKVTQKRRGQWGDVENLGPVINTEYEEEGVFVHPDGKTLYFSSNGHSTMGGYDVFKTTLGEDETWSKPENLGFPVNSPEDDLFFAISASGTHAYYSSVKKDSYGKLDIYKLTILGATPPLPRSVEDNLLASVTQPITEIAVEKQAISTSQVTLFRGETLDSLTRQPVAGQIEIVDNQSGETVIETTSNSATGHFLVSLPSGRNYGISVKAPDYLFDSENFDIPKGTGYNVVEKTVLLQPIEKGASIVLRNIFFDFNESTLRPESKRELQNMIDLMNANPKLRVEIGGHTDSKGSDDFNMRLSERRAQSVVKYLTDGGVAASRLVSKGYGESKPLVSNETEEGRQQNRRTEFKVLDK